MEPDEDAEDWGEREMLLKTWWLPDEGDPVASPRELEGEASPLEEGEVSRPRPGLLLLPVLGVDGSELPGDAFLFRFKESPDLFILLLEDELFTLSLEDENTTCLL